MNRQALEDDVPPGVLVRWTTSHLAWLETVAAARKEYAANTKAANRYQADQSKGRTLDLVGVIGEWAFGQWSGVPWAANTRPDYSGDVGRYEVRATPLTFGRLILHPADPDPRVFVLAIVSLTEQHATLRGWTFARDGKRPVHWSDPTKMGRHAFFVPQHRLQPMATLPKLERGSPT